MQDGDEPGGCASGRADLQVTQLVHNQVRMKIGSCSQSGNHHRGNAFEILCCVRLDLPASAPSQDRDEWSATRRGQGGQDKVSPPFKKVEFDISMAVGFPKVGELVDLASRDGIVEKSGSWYSYDGRRIGQARIRQDLSPKRDIADRSRVPSAPMPGQIGQNLVLEN